MNSLSGLTGSTCGLTGSAARWESYNQCVRIPVAVASIVICGPHLHRAIRGAQGVLLCRVEGNCQ